MSKLNMLVHLNAYEDAKDTNNPNLSNFKWSRDISGLDISEPCSKSINLPAGQSLDLADGLVSLNSDATTTYDLALKAGSSNIYRISHNGGTEPEFRTKRTSGADATTEITVTKNATLVTFTSTSGTALSLISNGVQVGDEVRVGSGFSLGNQGKFKIIALTATSLTVENESGVAEVVVLGASFDEQLNIYSSNGVQVGDKCEIIAGFSPVSFGVYDIVDVSHDYIEIYSNDSLPSESNISNNPQALSVYTNAKKFIYLETDQSIELVINESLTSHIVEPMSSGTCKKQGIFLFTGLVKSLQITNKSELNAKIFYILAE